ncbi:MAG: glycosyltransferase family 4 protein [bacterium]|nr:glycosyltransferase family 4 protein [bacterium]
MNIAIMLLNQGRGSGEVARQHARHLAQRGCRVHYMHPRVGEGAPGAVNHDIALHSTTMPVHEFLPAAKAEQKTVASMTADEALAYLPAYEAALDAVASELDVIVGHHANLVAVATHRVAKRHGKPFVLFLHGTGIEPRHHGGYARPVWDAIEAAIRAAAGILVTTDYVRDELVRTLVDLPHDRFLVLPCGVDLDEFHPGGSGEIREKYDLPETFVLCPGALTSSKGPQNVVEASRRYADVAPTIFIGDGELREELERELGDRGRFLGFVSADDRTRLVNAATILTAAPQKLEHFGIIYAEALAAGTPPVAYGGGGVPSVVTPDVGLLTERSPEALGSGIRELLSDPARREAMAAAGRPRAERLFSYPELVSILHEWLRHTVRGGSV